MAKSAIYLVNNTSLNVTDGDLVPLGTIIRRYGQHVRQDGNAVTVCDRPGCPGYYLVTVSSALETAAAGDYKLQLLKDGVPVIGGIAEINPAPAAAILPFNFVALIKNACGGTANLSLKLTGGDAKAVNVATTVERL